MIKSQLKIFINTIPKCLLVLKMLLAMCAFPSCSSPPSLAFKINLNTQCKEHFRENQKSTIGKAS